MLVYSAARIILTFGAASLMTVITALPGAAHAKTAPVSAPSPTAAAGNPGDRLCVRLAPVTGSIVAGKVCKTRQQWASEGVTFDEKNVAHQG